MKPTKGGNPAKERSITITASRFPEWNDISPANLLALLVFSAHIAEKIVMDTKT